MGGGGGEGRARRACEGNTVCGRCLFNYRKTLTFSGNIGTQISVTPKGKLQIKLKSSIFLTRSKIPFSFHKSQTCKHMKPSMLLWRKRESKWILEFKKPFFSYFFLVGIDRILHENGKRI